MGVILTIVTKWDDPPSTLRIRLYIQIDFGISPGPNPMTWGWDLTRPSILRFFDFSSGCLGLKGVEGGGII